MMGIEERIMESMQGLPDGGLTYKEKIQMIQAFLMASKEEIANVTGLCY